MKVFVEIAMRRGADPLVPMQIGGDRQLRRARTFTAVGAVGPTVGFRDLANRAGPDVFAQLAIAFLAVALISHLRGNFCLGRHRAHLPRLGDVVADGLFAIDVYAPLHCHHGRQGVVVIGRGDEHRVNLLAQLVEHFPVVGERLNFAGVAAFVGQRLLDGGNALVVHVHDSNQVFIERGFQVLHRPPAAADLHDANFFASIGSGEDVEGRSGQDAGGERALFQKGTTSQFDVHVCYQASLADSI